MGQSTLHKVRFAGMASCVPRRIVDNIEDAPPHLRSERERLVRNVGIQRRRLCPEWQCFSDLAFDAAETLLADLEWPREQIDALIVVTQSPDYITPATAIILQDRLALPQTTIAFDVNLGCSGYPFGLHILGSMIASGAIKRGLLLVGDRGGSLRDPLFSDAGTATALEYDADAAPMYFDLNSDGSGHKVLMTPVGGHREPVRQRHLITYRDENGFERSPLEPVLDGAAVLSFATQRIPPAIEQLLAYAKLEKDAVDYFVLHQANRMINETIRKKLGLPVEKTPSSLLDFGNTNGASLPITMSARLHAELNLAQRRLLLCGFGVGLSWGSAIVDIDAARFPAIIES